MAVKIGHASIDENGKAAGGKAGDQTKREVCMREWYNKGWNVVLRPKDPKVAEKSAAACEQACENPNVGYDQGGRNTLYKFALLVNFVIALIKSLCECDCSTLMHVCAIAGGANLTYGSNGLTTRSMRKAFVASGDYEALTDKKYLTSDKYLKRGDILLKEGSHTAMALEDGAEVAKTENQGGNTVKIELNVLKKGSKGEQVKTLQRLLIAMGYSCGSSGVDGSFGSATDSAVRKYQKDKKLEVDGAVGTATWTSLLK